MMDRLYAKLSEDMRSRRDQLEEGTCHDYLSYRVTVAEIRILRYVAELIREYEDEDDLVGD